MENISRFLSEQGIKYEKFDHPAVFTCEEAEKLLPPMPGEHTKNLFLRNRKGDRHFLVVTVYGKNVDIKQLKNIIGADKLSFASPERLMKYLGVEPGAATLLGLINDTGHQVEVFLDEQIASAEALQCHPLVNTATFIISKEGVKKFMVATGHEWRVINVPAG